MGKINILPIKKYFTIKEVAEIFGVTTLTLRNWDKSGKLKAMRNPINNYRIYKPEDIERLLHKIESKRKSQPLTNYLKKLQKVILHIFR